MAYADIQRFSDGARTILYRARRADDGKTVVIKELRKIYPSARRMARFRREFEILSAAHGPGVVEGLDFTVDKGIARIVMEDFGGRALAEVFDARRPALRDVLEVGIATARALEGLHALGIVHKDITPTNIVFNPQTRQLKLIDFGISSVVRREDADITAIRTFEGTPLYMSPEQTGRMNRSIDHRSDLYSLGATLYELVSGAPPFVSTDRLDLVHAHIAKIPTPLHEASPDTPETLARIIAMLLAKRAEDRYQSAAGLRFDLESCLRDLDETGAIEPFDLRVRDLLPALTIPERLYGRDAELKGLEEAFERACEGASELLMVTGFSGIGKTALVHEVLRGTVERGAHFIAGKVDQFSRGEPYDTLIQAFRQRLQQILTESRAQVDGWRVRIQSAVGRGGRILTEAMPEAALLLGEQPPLDALPPTEAENRFRIVLQRFVRALAGPNHPLVIFLDDLQWADLPTLKLMEALTLDPDAHHVLILGSYRDREVGPTHPLRATLARIVEAGHVPGDLKLGPLSSECIAELLSDTLHRPRATVAALASLLHQKTGGNPFFIVQLLKDMAEGGLVRVDTDAGRWTWNLTRIGALAHTDNVLDFMAQRLAELPQQSQRALQIAACIGNTFDLGLLATAMGQTRWETQRDLATAIAHELILPNGEGYWFDRDHPRPDGEVPEVTLRFAHDRVEQVAGALGNEDERRAIHLTLGRHLRDTLGEDARQQRLFDIVEHFNNAAPLLETQQERDALLELNLAAGLRAMQSAAYEPAHKCLSVAAAQCAAGVWTRRYKLALEIFVRAAEAASLAGDHEAMARMVSTVENRGESLLDKTRGRAVNIQAYVARNAHKQGVMAAIAALSELGMDLPESPDGKDVERELVALLGALAQIDPAKITDMPALNDPTIDATRRIMAGISSAAYLAVPNLLPILSFRLVNSTLEHGVSKASAWGFTLLGLVLSAIGMLDQSAPIGELALGLLERWEDRGIRTRVRHVVNTHVRIFSRPFEAQAAALAEVFELGLDTGDLEYGCWAAHNHSVFTFYSGEHLDKTALTLKRFADAIAQHKQMAVFMCQQPFVQLVENLRGASKDPRRLAGPDYDEDAALEQLEAIGHRGAVFLLTTAMLHARVLFGDPTAAVRIAAHGEPFQDGAGATAHIPIFYFFDALAHLELARRGEGEARDHHLARATAGRDKIQGWADFGPVNFAHRLALIDAELHNVQGDVLSAMAQYDKAIALCKDHGLHSETPLANELAGRFHLAQGRATVARTYLREAHYGWVQWGAKAKAAQLSQAFPELRVDHHRERVQTSTARTTVGRTASTQEVNSDALDVESLFRANQALSSEIRLEALLIKVIRVLVENAGATRGFLLTEREGRWVVRASGDAHGTQIAAPGTDMADCEEIPTSIVQYVARTREQLVLEDAHNDPRFRGDPRLQSDGSLSALCGPMVHKGVQSGIVLLENHLTSGAFTPERIQVMDFLGAQAAISLENARLYEETRAMARSFERFVPSAFVETLGHDKVMDIAIGDSVRRDVSVLFTDLRGFTKLFERLSVADGFALLNDYLSRMSPIIESHGGFIDKFIGDAIMALFPGEADGALLAAIEMCREVEAMNQEGAVPLGAHLSTGTGLHAGPLLLGTLGSADRLDLTAIGNTVNASARLESATKTIGAPVLISGAIRARLRGPETLALRPLGPIQLQGRRDALDIYEAFGADGAEIVAGKRASLQDWSAGMNALRRGDSEGALAAFDRCLDACPGDAVAKGMRERAEAQNRGDADWNDLNLT